jgi:hypothetical protein
LSRSRIRWFIPVEQQDAHKIKIKDLPNQHGIIIMFLVVVALVRDTT